MSEPNDSQPPKFVWTDAYKLGYGPMDDTHQDFVDKVNAILMAGDDTLLARLDDFVAHTEAHFGQEAEWMANTGFPAAQCHIDEHDAVMKSVREVRALLSDNPGRRNADIARSLAQELKNWFPGHADYLDSALAQWMVKKIFGGAPIVFRRG